MDFYKDKDKYINTITHLSLMLMGIGVGTKTGAFTLVGALFALIIFFMDKNRFANIKSIPFTGTIVFFTSYVLVVYLECLYGENVTGQKLVLRNFEKIITFFVIYFFIGNSNRSLLYTSLGLMIGLMINTGVVCMQANDIMYESASSKRYGGLFGNPNSLGSVLELQIPVFIYMCYYYRKSKTLFVVFTLTSLCAFWNLYMTGSRGACMAVISEIIVMSGILLYRKLQSKNAVFYVLGAFMLCLAVVLGTALVFNRGYDSERLLLWGSAWKMFLDYPLFGVGFNNWEDFYPTLYISYLATEPHLTTPHNLYLFIMAETGLAGMISYFSIIVWQVKESIKYSSLEVNICSENLTIGDMFIALTIGILIHNLVDVSALSRYYMLMQFLIWGVCCLHFTRVEKKKDEITTVVI